VVLLLHGLPSSSFMFRDLMPRLADRFRVIAPDYPGFGP
jgi:pimeloyl-ACP methyl ester carboxylesterase